MRAMSVVGIRGRLVAGLAAASLVAGLAGCAPATVADPPVDSSAPPTTSTAPATSTPPPSVPPATPTVEPEPTTVAPEPTPSATEASTTPAPSTAPSASTPPADGSSTVLAGTNHSAAAASWAYPAKQVLGWLEGDVTPTEKVVFLTFDDGPNHVITPKVLDALKEAGVYGTFFVVGTEIDEAPDMLKRAVAEGSSIAIHSWSHNYKHLYPGRVGNADRIVAEHDKTAAALRDVLGASFKTGAWRYPGGHMSWKKLAPADSALAQQGVYWIDWNGMTGDAEPKKRRPTTVAGMVKLATAPIANEQKVAVILAHDTPGKDLTVKSLPAIIKAYKEAGYTFGVIA